MQPLPTPQIIKQHAAESGLTMQEVCKAAGINFTTWWRWERRGASPTIATVQAFLDVIEHNRRPV